MLMRYAHVPGNTAAAAARSSVLGGPLRERNLMCSVRFFLCQAVVHLHLNSLAHVPGNTAAAAALSWVDRYENEPRKGSDILVQSLEREGVDQVGGCTSRHQVGARQGIK